MLADGMTEFVECGPRHGIDGADWKDYEGVEEHGGIVFLNTNLQGWDGGGFGIDN